MLHRLRGNGAIQQSRLVRLFRNRTHDIRIRALQKVRRVRGFLQEQALLRRTHILRELAHLAPGVKQRKSLVTVTSFQSYFAERARREEELARKVQESKDLETLIKFWKKRPGIMMSFAQDYIARIDTQQS